MKNGIKNTCTLFSQWSNYLWVIRGEKCHALQYKVVHWANRELLNIQFSSQLYKAVQHLKNSIETCRKIWSSTTFHWFFFSDSLKGETMSLLIMWLWTFRQHLWRCGCSVTPSSVDNNLLQYDLQAPEHNLCVAVFQNLVSCLADYLTYLSGR